MLGRYTLLREIARSNDIVWEGFDPQMNRHVAVKELTLPPTLQGQARRERIERFYREARAAGTMSHPNIVTIHEVGEDDGRYFIAMEYLEGRTLRERIAVGGALPLPEAVAVTTALCDALEYAHSRGVIHRDIKPDNVHLLPDGRVKLTDFGIARITHEDALTVDGQVFGTPSYMSPEQVVGQKIDTRSDLFSLGIVIYEMITGRKPFFGDSVVTITYKIMNDDPAPLGLHGVHPMLESVVRRALAKSPAARYGTAGELRAAIVTAAGMRTMHPSTPTLGSMPAANAAQPSPYPNNPMAGAQATIAYSAQTQFGLSAPPLAVDPAATASDAPAPNPSPLQRSTRSFTTVFFAIVFIGVILIGGGWAMTQAFRNFSLQATLQKDEDAYAKASRLYETGDYDNAATAFRALRANASDQKMRTKATQGLSFSYQQIGARFQRQNNLNEAARYFAAAVECTPNDRNALQSLGNIQRALNLPPAASGTSGTTGSGSNNGNGNGSAVLDGMSPRPPADAPTLPPGSRSTRAEFQNANAARESRARQLLSDGDSAMARGDKEGALKYWYQAVQDGPGTPSGMAAQDRITKSAADSGFPSL